MTGVSLSTYLSDKILNHVLRNTSYTSPATVYAALYTVAPTDAGGGTEVSGGSYARVAITFGAPAANSPSGRKSTNSAIVTFPTATADWGTVTHVGVFDASTVGNLLLWGALTSSITILDTNTRSFEVGDLVCAVD